mmetsp:Transcript_49580/g.88559  ORF Transcript_49580/g.88559 Transcript_49580/m.88559 type:complete len:158 (-) Transcript_49580:815-1288(-)
MRFQLLSTFLRTSPAHCVFIAGNHQGPQLGTGLARLQWKALSAYDGPTHWLKLQKTIAVEVINLRTNFPQQVTLGTVGNAHLSRGVTVGGPSETHWHVWGANASNWNVWNDTTNVLATVCTGSGQATSLKGRRAVPGWFGIVTTPCAGYERHQLGLK